MYPVPAAPRTRFELLQVFRGLAAVVVVVFHLAVLIYQKAGGPLAGPAIPGQSGVDFFFVLSGFIIYYAHKNDFGKPDRLRRFGWRRFIRIYPLYLIVTLLVLPLYIFGFGNAGKLSGDVIAKSFLLLPQAPRVYPIVNVGWTLSHEALFYGLFALAIWLRPRIIVPIFGVLLLGTVVGLFFNIPGPYWISNWLLSPYNLEFAAGCVAAQITAKRFAWMLPVGIVLLIAVWIYATVTGIKLGDSVAERMIVLFGVPYWLIVTGSASLESYRRVNTPRLLTAIGDATYSIYLSHFVVLAALVPLLSRKHFPLAANAIFSVSIATGLGYLLYRNVEKPLLNKMR